MVHILVSVSDHQLQERLIKPVGPDAVLQINKQIKFPIYDPLKQFLGMVFPEGQIIIKKIKLFNPESVYLKFNLIQDILYTSDPVVIAENAFITVGTLKRAAPAGQYDTSGFGPCTAPVYI